MLIHAILYLITIKKYFLNANPGRSWSPFLELSCMMDDVGLI